MIVLLIFLVPLLSGLFAFFLKKDMAVRSLALISSFITLALTLVALSIGKPEQLVFHADWMGSLGSSFSLELDGMSQMLCLLTAVS